MIIKIIPPDFLPETKLKTKYICSICKIEFYGRKSSTTYSYCKALLKCDLCGKEWITPRLDRKFTNKQPIIVILRKRLKHLMIQKKNIEVLD